MVLIQFRMVQKTIYTHLKCVNHDTVIEYNDVVEKKCE